MKTFIYELKDETLVSQFTEGFDEHQDRKIFYDWITYGIGIGSYIEFDTTVPKDEFMKMIKKDGWKLKEVVQH
jgi:hypothetical protein